MANILSWLQIHILPVIKPPKTIQIIDIIQIALIAYVVYKLILWMKNTRSYTVLKGILFVVAFVVVAYLLKMEVFIWLIGNVSVVAITALVIIFQPELRKALERMGHTRLFTSLLYGREDDENRRFSNQTLNDIILACYEMGETRTGALIVIEKDIRLTDFSDTGIPVDAVVSSQLLMNIFEHNTPLHDGAVIIRNNRIAAATCYLPLSDNMELSKELGTRHRAAIGISELSDSLTIIVSEETGKVSYAREGKIHLAVSPGELRTQLEDVQRLYKERTQNGRRKKRQ